jgi:hypothetical protein
MDYGKMVKVRQIFGKTHLEAMKSEVGMNPFVASAMENHNGVPLPRDTIKRDRSDRKATNPEFRSPGESYLITSLCN